jgi:hypothetical protein
MPQRIWADPEDGFPGKWEENDGTWAQGTYKYLAYRYGPDEVPDAHAKSIAELRTEYWDEAQAALVIPFTGGRTFTFGPKLLSHATDTTMVLIGITFHYLHKRAPPDVCSCGKLSFRHAVEYHESDAERAARTL